jgi:uncharacterized protein (DUF2147 family)
MYKMKKILFTIICALMAFASNAQDLNSKGDNILGNYLSIKDGGKSKIKITKAADGTYTAQVYWVEKALDANGNKRKDVKNPDKSLRNVDVDKIVLVKGLKYDKSSKQWSGAKIYDPTKGIKVNATAMFEAPGKLKLRATILGIGQTIYWQKIK